MQGMVIAQDDPYSASGLFDDFFDYSKTRSYFYYDGTLAAGDTIGVNDSTILYTYYVKTLKPQQPKLYIELDSIGGKADTVYVDLESKSFPSDSISWTLRERATWTQGRDTAILLASDSAHMDELWRININGQNDSISVLIDNYIFKFWEP